VVCVDHSCDLRKSSILLIILINIVVLKYSRNNLVSFIELLCRHDNRTLFNQELYSNHMNALLIADVVNHKLKIPLTRLK
jgi:hypothetical protein